MTEEIQENVVKCGLIFRNYVPEDKSLLELKLDQRKVIDVKPLIKDQLELVKNAAAPSEITAENLQQKKIDEDLKRSIQKQLDILKLETRKAIAEIASQKYHSNDEE